MHNGNMSFVVDCFAMCWHFSVGAADPQVCQGASASWGVGDVLLRWRSEQQILTEQQIFTEERIGPVDLEVQKLEAFEPQSQQVQFHACLEPVKFEWLF